MARTQTSPSIKRPSRLLQLLEIGRAPWELGAGLAAWPLLQRAPRGDGHAVLVLPGLIATDFSTGLLRRFLKGLGYDVHGWGLGRNLGPREGVVDSMQRRVEALHAQHSGRAVSLVGWSLGGAFARLLANQRPELVRCVITLGSPITGTPEGTNAHGVYKWVSGETRVDPELAEAVRATPSVPCTSIYSRSDGIVSWRCSVQPTAPLAENIEVIGSHVGLGAHPAVLYAVADRLAQPEGAWRPFERRDWRALVYQDPARA